MPEFKLKAQEEIDKNYQGINLSEFTYSDAEDFSKEEVLDFFLHSKSFTVESRRERIKNHTGSIKYLSQAFEIDLVKISDFKKVDKNGVVRFLNEYVEDWTTTDRDDFLIIQNKFIEFLNNVQSNCFYLVDKDWFDQKDKRLREPESWIYDYYFLIVWLDENRKTLTVSEWTYD